MQRADQFQVEEIGGVDRDSESGPGSPGAHFRHMIPVVFPSSDWHSAPSKLQVNSHGANGLINAERLVVQI